jgi:hypothetical protein
MSPRTVKIVKRIVFLGHLLSHSTDDAAKTQTFMSASKRILEERIHGEFWAPRISWKPLPGFWMRYEGCGKEKLKAHAANRDEWNTFWNYCENAMEKAEQGHN